MDLETVNSNEVRFLEVTTTKTVEGFSTRPTYKASNISKPLCCTSAHPKHVHSSWPRGLMMRSISLSSSPKIAEQSLQALRLRLKQHFAPASQINLVVNDQSNLPQRLRSSCSARQCIVWVPVDYHPAWAWMVKKAMSSFQMNEYNQLLLRTAFGKEVFCLKIAWRNLLPKSCAWIREKL